MLGKHVHKIEYGASEEMPSFSVPHPFLVRTLIVSIYDVSGLQILPQFLGVKQDEVVFLMPARVTRDRYPLTVVIVG